MIALHTPHSFVIIEVNPTFDTEFVIAVYNSEDAAYEAREIATKRLTQEALDFGVFHRVTAFQTNKLYH